MIRSTLFNQMKENDDGLVDFLSNVAHIDSEKIVVDNFVLVDEQLEMRLDILSYATGIDLDVILKFNGISNPFEVKQGMIIAIPTAASFDDALTLLNVTQTKLQRQKIITSEQLLEKIKHKSSTSKYTPSKKQTETANYTKSEDGILRF